MLQNTQNTSLKSNKPVKICVKNKWIGKVPFKTSLEEQEKLKDEAKKGCFYFLGFETNRPAITKGVRANCEDIIWDADHLEKHNIELVELRRGGQATLHPPGQLVIYPVMHLPLLKIKIRDFIVALESITQSFFQDFGIETKRMEKYSGLSTSKGKIAFFGIHITGGVSQHGLSVNVCNDLSLFSSIKSCGTENRPHDNLISHGINLTTEDLFYKWSKKAQSFWNL